MLAEKNNQERGNIVQHTIETKDRILKCAIFIYFIEE